MSDSYINFCPACSNFWNYCNCKFYWEPKVLNKYYVNDNLCFAIETDRTFNREHAECMLEIIRINNELFKIIGVERNLPNKPLIEPPEKIGLLVEPYNGDNPKEQS